MIQLYFSHASPWGEHGLAWSSWLEFWSNGELVLYLICQPPVLITGGPFSNLTPEISIAGHLTPFVGFAPVSQPPRATDKPHWSALMIEAQSAIDLLNHLRGFSHDAMDIEIYGYGLARALRDCRDFTLDNFAVHYDAFAEFVNAMDMGML